MTISIRSAVAEDAAWIVVLLRDGARQGHFRDTLSAQAVPLVEELLHVGFLTMVKLRHNRPEVCRVDGDVRVATWEDQPAAFLICMHDREGYELHLAGTRPEFIRRGCFKALVRHALASSPGEGRVFARCYATSSVAIEALKAHGFVRTSGSDPVELDWDRTFPLPENVEAVPRSWWQRLLGGFRRAD
ncbi:hypothetical protein AN993_13040 [Stenotrophomonas maltophilia]|nr:hypothetical protein AN993_13040 [Stenotrophomonas maltophilia]MBA0243901.1 N-acetyltransferase [Stenotrophomonas maltophilia]MBA0247130.1 N-acetyltransferase [Stenotrophomonas maltophilia]MBA0307550.1 N-acetyltransferase [Stenotrophomonas maltophilia]MBA0439753.1 N-acetyltransferase [Stenotrophomonas maltophilia]